MHTSPEGLKPADDIFGACWHTTGNGFLAWPDRLLQAAIGTRPLYRTYLLDNQPQVRDVSDLYPADEIYDVCVLLSSMLTRAVSALVADDVDRAAIAPVFPQVYLCGPRCTVSTKDRLRGLYNRKVRRENADIRLFQRHNARLCGLYKALGCTTPYLLMGWRALLADMAAGNLTPAADDSPLVSRLKARLTTAHPLLVRRLLDEAEKAL